MSDLTALKAATTLSHVAHILDIKPGMLSFQLYKKPKATLYKKFEIPKSHGGTREISAPEKDLKFIQHRLSLLLQRCVEEINVASGHVETEKNPGIAHGFKRKHSIMSNARAHQTRRYVFNVDLHDFFGTIHIGRIIGFFTKDKSFALHPKVALVLAQIACHEGKLPQGSPCSPVISNLIGHMMDVQLVRLATATGCTYTRYADDLTFSSNKQSFPSRVAKQTDEDKDIWTLGVGLKRIVKRSGFSFNDKKTRMQYKDSRQEVTGLTVNRKINAHKDYRNTVRAMVHRLITTGSFEYIYKSVDDKGVEAVKTEPGKTSELRGMLAFIDHVEQYHLKTHKDQHPEVTPSRSREKLFRQFLLYDRFYASSLPVVLCEGETDNIYLTHAIHRLAADFPNLATKDLAGKVKLNVRLHKYLPKLTGRILHLKGGTGQLGLFVKDYAKHITTIFKAPGGQHPVIVLIDNDSGQQSVMKEVSKIVKGPISLSADSIHVGGNLYVVLTPLNPPAIESYIEQCFDADALGAELQGKTFKHKNVDPEKNYGKAIFAKAVVRTNPTKINFDGFKPLLARIQSVITEHSSKIAAAASKTATLAAPTT